MEMKIGQLDSAVKRIGRQVDIHEDKIRALELNEPQQTMELKELISQAVAQGNKSSATTQTLAFNKLEGKFDTFMQASERVHKELQENIRELQNRETKKLAREAEEIKKAKKENQKHATRTAIAVVVTFFATLLINNFFDYFFNL